MLDAGASLRGMGHDANGLRANGLGPDFHRVGSGRPGIARMAEVLARNFHGHNEVGPEVGRALQALLDRKPHKLYEFTNLVPGSVKVIDRDNLPSHHVARTIQGIVCQVTLREGRNESPLLIVIQPNSQFKNRWGAILCPLDAPQTSLQHPGHVMTAIKNRIARDPNADVCMLSRPYDTAGFGQQGLTVALLKEAEATVTVPPGYRILNPDHESPTKYDLTKYVDLNEYNRGRFLLATDRIYSKIGLDRTAPPDERDHLKNLYQGLEDADKLDHVLFSNISPANKERILCQDAVFLGFP